MTTFPGDRAEHFAILAANVESAFEGAHVGWRGFLDDRRDAAAPVRDRIVRSLAEVPAWTVTGPDDLRLGRTPTSSWGSAHVIRWDVAGTGPGSPKTPGDVFEPRRRCVCRPFPSNVSVDGEGPGKCRWSGFESMFAYA